MAAGMTGRDRHGLDRCSQDIQNWWGPRLVTRCMVSLLAEPSVREAALVFLLGEGEDTGGPRETHFPTPSARVTAHINKPVSHHALLAPHNSSQYQYHYIADQGDS